MKTTAFIEWLNSLNKYDKTTIANRVSNCVTVEKFEGDLDQHYASNNLHNLIEKLTYSTKDKELNNLPKHNIIIKGDIYNGSATYKSAVNLYKNFLEDYADNSADLANSDESLFAEEILDKIQGLNYELDLKNAILNQLPTLFPEYHIFGKANEGIEYIIEEKRIDILLEDEYNNLLALELKAGVANFKTLGQILMYVGLLSKKFPDRQIKGCIIANTIDKSLKDAKITTQNISLKSYNINVQLTAEE